MKQRGFTLIELLVVIAIIGVLSAVVLASLNTARSKGSDAAIKSNLATIQTQAELYYGDASPNGYGTQAFTATTAAACAAGMFGNATIAKALLAAYNTSGGTSGNIACVAAGTSYAIAVKLVSPSPAEWWCVDSAGGATNKTTAFPIASFSC